MTLSLDDCTPGLLAYIHWDKKYPPLYASMSEMPYIDGLILEFCIHTHVEWLENLITDPTTGRSIPKPSEAEQAAKLDAFTQLLARSGALPPDSPAVSSSP